MTRRSFLRNLGLAAAALGVPVAAAASRIPMADALRDLPLDADWNHPALVRALATSGKPKASMAYLRASMVAGHPVPITYSTSIKPAGRTNG